MIVLNKPAKFILKIVLGLLALVIVSAGDARADPGNIYLPAIYRLTFPTSGNSLVNPGFEDGDTGWTFFYDNGNPIRTTSLAHTGAWSAELGASYDPANPVAYPRRAYIQQMVYIQPATPVLQFWEYIVSDETSCLSFFGDFVAITIDGQELARASICSPVEGQPVPWTIRQVDLSAYTGKWVRLRIEYTSDSTLPSDYYVDDFAFLAKP
jgi:hypothetical protein